METVSETAFHKAKKNQARSKLYGLPPSTIATRLDNFRKYPPAGNWRHIGKLKILYAYSKFVNYELLIHKLKLKKYFDNSCN